MGGEALGGTNKTTTGEFFLFHFSWPDPKDLSISFSKHITDNFPYPRLVSVLDDPLLGCLHKSYLVINTKLDPLSESLSHKLDIIFPNFG